MGENGEKKTCESAGMEVQRRASIEKHSPETPDFGGIYIQILGKAPPFQWPLATVGGADRPAWGFHLMAWQKNPKSQWQ